MSKAHGKFVWYDLMTTDLEAATAFYGAVIGWSSRHAGMPNAVYLLYSAAETTVAGAMALTAEMLDQGARPSWTGYAAVDDVDAAVAKVGELGGAVHRGPEDIPGVGRFAVVGDPQGAVFALFKAGPGYPEPPSPPIGTPGHCGWRELHAADWAGAFAFYAALFGWTKDMAMDMGPMGTYQTFAPADGPPAIGGMMNKRPEMPRPFWLYYFGVDAADAAVDRVKAGGGQALMDPQEVPGGAWIVPCLDPQGAMFALLAPKR